MRNAHFSEWFFNNKPCPISELVEALRCGNRRVRAVNFLCFISREEQEIKARKTKPSVKRKNPEAAK
jgi:hypothetical protein